MVSKKKEKKSKGRGVIKERKEHVLSSLEQLGGQVYDQLAKKEFPTVKMPSRSIANIIYDDKTRQYILGKRNVKRSARNVRHVRPFTQLLWTAMFGDLTVEYTVPGYEGRTLNLSSHPDGVMIGPALTTSEFVRPDKKKVDKVIAIEKGGLFTRFIEERVHQRFKAVLIHTAGQAPRATRFLLRRLNQELDLPVYIFTDGDPWGMHIAMVIISGSANAAHLRELNTPDAIWGGVWATDIVDYKLPSDPLTDLDVKRLNELEKDPRYAGGLWQREIDTFRKVKRNRNKKHSAGMGSPTSLMSIYLRS